MTKPLLIVTLFLIVACKNKKVPGTSAEREMSTTYRIITNESGRDVQDDQPTRFEDGEYCANVEYYNPNTGTRSDYTLTVEIEDGELARIDWPNGGWLDESHFTSEELDDDGTVSFTSDRGYEYTVTIDSEGPCWYSSSRIDDDLNELSSDDEDSGSGDALDEDEADDDN